MHTTTELLTIRETIEHYGLSKHQLLSLCPRDDFPAVKIGRKWLIRARGLDAWLDEAMRKGEVSLEGKGDA